MDEPVSVIFYKIIYSINNDQCEPLLTFGEFLLPLLDFRLTVLAVPLVFWGFVDTLLVISCKLTRQNTVSLKVKLFWVFFS